MELTLRQKWIYGSFFIAIFSMFLPWATMGIREESGWKLDYYIFLACWAIPCINAYKNIPQNLLSKISMSLAGVALIHLIEGGTFKFYGETFYWEKGAGFTVYVLAWILGLYSELFMKESHFTHSSDRAKNDEELYLKIMEDFEKGSIDPALWAKCTVLKDGDEKAAKYEYIRQKVEILKKNSDTSGERKPSLKNLKNMIQEAISSRDNSAEKPVIESISEIKNLDSLELITILNNKKTTKEVKDSIKAELKKRKFIPDNW